MDTLSESKFEHPIVKAAIEEIFEDPVKKVLVVYDVQDSSVIEEARNEYGIEIGFIWDLILDMDEIIGMKGYRDDVLRLIQLIRRSKIEFGIK